VRHEGKVTENGRSGQVNPPTGPPGENRKRYVPEWFVGIEKKCIFIERGCSARKGRVAFCVS